VEKLEPKLKEGRSLRGKKGKMKSTATTGIRLYNEAAIQTEF
jgi:hypothetical protein